MGAGASCIQQEVRAAEDTDIRSFLESLDDMTLDKIRKSVAPVQGHSAEADQMMGKAGLPSTSQLERELCCLLAMRKLSAKFTEARAWCETNGAECIEEILEAELATDFVHSLGLKQCNADKLLQDVLQWGSGDRAGPPDLFTGAADRNRPHGTGHRHARDVPSLDPAPFAARVKHGGNRCVPPVKWGMTVRQFNEFIQMCTCCATEWKKLETGEGIVTGSQLCKMFVKPFTQGTGSSVALLFNPVEPCQALAMISHTWKADVSETAEAVNDLAERMFTSDPPELVIWFCMFANYQPNDGKGPSVEEQIEMDPFGQVINLPDLRFMGLIITSTEDPYERLWCVYELDVALNVMDKRKSTAPNASDAFVTVEFSQRAHDVYLDRMRHWYLDEDQASAAGMNSEQLAKWHDDFRSLGPEYAYFRQSVDCEKAQCSRSEDDAMIRSYVEKSGGWERLNQQMANFRRPRT